MTPKTMKAAVIGRTERNAALIVLLIQGHPWHSKDY